MNAVERIRPADLVDHPAREVDPGIRVRVERVDQTYDQHTRDIDLRTRSLMLSAAESIAYQEVLVRQNAAELERGRRSVETAVRAAAAVLGVLAPTR